MILWPMCATKKITSVETYLQKRHRTRITDYMVNSGNMICNHDLMKSVIAVNTLSKATWSLFNMKQKYYHD